MTTRAQVEAWAARYFHRADFTQDDISTAIATVSSDLAARLKTPQNAVRLDIEAGAPNPAPLGDELRQIESVESATYGGWEALQAVTRVYGQSLHANPREWGIGGVGFYYVTQGELYVIPSSTAARRVFGWGAPGAITLDPASTNDVLQLYPELYRYGVLTELAYITQDAQLAVAYSNAFEAALARINYAADNLRTGNAPAVRSV